MDEIETENKAGNKKQKYPKTIKAIVADLRERGELDEEKWKRFKQKSLLVKAYVVAAALIGSAVCVYYNLQIIAMILPIVAMVLLIIQHRDELFKVICMNLAEPVEGEVIEAKKEINIAGGGKAINLRYKYFVDGKKYGVFRKIIPAFFFENNNDNPKIFYNPYFPKKHILIMPQPKNNIYEFNLRKEKWL